MKILVRINSNQAFPISKNILNINLKAFKQGKNEFLTFVVAFQIKRLYILLKYTILSKKIALKPPAQKNFILIFKY
ncbi:hypothetical protein SAMN04488111_0196 [Lutibacter flavus]|uniref:Uncharacterized protein n=1 Tax=Lutibacter flavus TaxID=691689 RepID=A0A238VAZ5_9FLAO|nr:hypothetical protein SAMN04488111_0196 [Lutibacter flavus]